MAFCVQCGKQVDVGTVCSACGRLSVPDGLEAMTAELQRQHKQTRYILLAMGVVLLLAVALVAGWMLLGGRKGSDHPADSVPKPQAAVPAQDASSQISKASGTAPETSPEQPAQPPSTIIAPRENSHVSGSSSAPARIDPQSVESVLNSMKQRDVAGAAPLSPPHSNAPNPADRYPGSEPVDVKDAGLPDIGVPVASQVYTTSDSLATVMAYYERLYPEAQVMEISGQNIIAVDKPGMTKVFAIATTGSETRIAIVQPGN